MSFSDPQCKRLTSAAVIGSCLGWMAAGVPFIMAGNHRRAGQYIGRLLYIAARRRWREAKALVEGVVDKPRLSPNAPPAETIEAFCPGPESEAVA